VAAAAREWTPANDVEAALLQASNDGDQRTYFQILAQAPLYLPASAEAQRRGTPKLYSWDSDGVRIIPVYTSLAALANDAGGVADAYAVTTYPELAANWPDSAWKLAVDPQLSIGVYVNIEDIGRAARGELVVPSAAELVASAVGELVTANPVEESLRELFLAGDVPGYLRAMLAADVLLPTARPVSDPAEIAEPAFPWLPMPGPPDRAIAVFTSPERMTEGWLSETPTLLVPFISVAQFWPGPAYTLVVNAGTPLEVTISGDSVRQLVEAMQAELTGEPDGADTALPADDRPVVNEGVLRAPRQRDQRSAVDPSLVMLQKVLAHDEVRQYLQDGRHLVTGFVYPAEALRHLITPAALYAGLGLIYAGSPFQENDAAVHVLRWLAHCPALYRIARGGPDEATRRANRGWMVEPAPFRGTGAAAGDDSVPQLKVDSVALPHGAVLVELTSTGQETVVASFDADFANWLPLAPLDLRSIMGAS
jgi:SseB protein N-terminal domain